MIKITLDDNHELIALGNQYTVYNIHNNPIRKTYEGYKLLKPYATLQDMLEDNPYGLNEDELKYLSTVDNNLEKYVTHEDSRVRLLVAKSGLFCNELKNDKSLTVRITVARIADSTQNNELLIHFATDSCEHIRCVVASNYHFSGIMIFDKSNRVRKKAQISGYQYKVKQHFEEIKKIKEEIKKIYKDNPIDKELDRIKIDDDEYYLR